MVLKPETFLIACPLIFFAGFVDAIGGGGGLISLPAYLLAGVPAHQAVATNKLSSVFGTFTSVSRFIQKGLVNFRLAVPSVIFALLGSSIGANISLRVEETVMQALLFILLPITAAIVMNRNLFGDQNREEEAVGKRTYVVAVLAAFFLGMYDGFYGPGSGTFLIIAFTVFARMNVLHANAQAKVINFATNIGSLAVFLSNGQVVIPLGLAAALCNMAGSYLGASLAIKNGSRITKPIILFVLVLLFAKILFERFAG